MSLSKAQYEAKRWLRTAEEDLKAARTLNDAADAEQALEKAEFFVKRVNTILGE